MDEQKLVHLDELEDYPRLYGRRVERIITDGEDKKVSYCGNKEKILKNASYLYCAGD